MAKLESISARELSGKVSKAVETALQRNEKFKNLKPEPGTAVLLPPWLVGFVLRDPPRDRTLGDVESLAIEVAQVLGAAEARAVVVQNLRNILVGYFPKEIITVIRE